jgi:hypothetical protein
LHGQGLASHVHTHTRQAGNDTESKKHDITSLNVNLNPNTEQDHLIPASQSIVAGMPSHAIRNASTTSQCSDQQSSRQARRLASVRESRTDKTPILLLIYHYVHSQSLSCLLPSAFAPQHYHIPYLCCVGITATLIYCPCQLEQRYHTRLSDRCPSRIHKPSVWQQVGTQAQLVGQIPGMKGIFASLNQVQVKPMAPTLLYLLARTCFYYHSQERLLCQTADKRNINESCSPNGD